MKPINLHLFEGHLQSLRRIFDLTLKSPNGNPFVLVPHNIGGNIEVVLQSNEDTVSVKSDGGAVVCAVLYSGNKKVCCSFFERWIVVGRKKAQEFKFDSAGLTFFLAIAPGTATESYKQIFRLEWDNWVDQDPPNKAAYPHWQFDRWLTASTTPDVTLETIRKSLEADEDETADEAQTFETAEQAIAASALEIKPEARPDLRWFTRLHFPSIAPWATRPIGEDDIDLEEPIQSHRSVPETPKQLEDWIRSSLAYLRNEIATYD